MYGSFMILPGFDGCSISVTNNLHAQGDKMEATNRPVITVQTTINAPIGIVWDKWTGPEHIMQWNQASPDWHTPRAENDLRVGGKYSSRMEARDGSEGFDFWGVYSAIEKHKHIASTLGDHRRVEINFSEQAGQTRLIETFEAEDQNTLELQKFGWQSILDSFKKYVEATQ